MRLKHCVCGKEFSPRNLSQKFCSPKCYWGNMDKECLKRRTGKYIICETCKKSFYITKSHLAGRKFCSVKCIKVSPRAPKIKTPKVLICKQCQKIFVARTCSRKFCTIECFFKQSKVERTGKGNPNHKTGFYAEKTGQWAKGSKTAMLHLRACAKYRKAFLEKNEYPFCEVCGVNANAAKRFEVHHIYFASHYPKHPELHNFRNLVHICYRCHKKFHAYQYPEELKKLELDRGLRELFKN